MSCARGVRSMHRVGPVAARGRGAHKKLWEMRIECWRWWRRPCGWWNSRVSERCLLRPVMCVVTIFSSKSLEGAPKRGLRASLAALKHCLAA